MLEHDGSTQGKYINIFFRVVVFVPCQKYINSLASALYGNEWVVKPGFNFLGILYAEGRDSIGPFLFR